ncbi:MAG: ABC transporter substrate-binding protein [Arenicellales bacterium]|nr:ABC transporter substrate-binding protein [Arenicellales bacterium]
MSRIKIQFTRFSAFYSPLIATISGGFLKSEGLDASHSIAPPGRSAIAALMDGGADVVQSALSQGFTALEQNEQPPAVHFAQINEMDGFFVAGRTPEPSFDWNRLVGKKVLVDHGGQPLAMFRYACHQMNVPYDTIEAIDAGDSASMESRFRDGDGDYIHLQGPAPQQLEKDGAGSIVASVGSAIGPCGFSSLAATREWLASDVASAFMRAYRQARDYVNLTPAAEIAAAEAAYFPGIDVDVLASTIGQYQVLGCWTPHVEITRAAYEVTLDVFAHAGLIHKRHPFEAVCVAPPAAG